MKFNIVSWFSPQGLWTVAESHQSINRSQILFIEFLLHGHHCNYKIGKHMMYKIS